MRTMTKVAALAVLVLGGPLACDGDLTVPDYNNPSLEDLVNNPTPAGVRSATAGLLIGARNGYSAYVLSLGIIGREMYDLDPAEPRPVAEYLVGPLDPGAFGGGNWNFRYANLRNASIVLGAVDAVEGMSDAEKSAIRGFTRTLMALDLLLVINTRDTNGAVIDIGGEIGADPAPLVGRDAVFAEVVRLLDLGAQELQAGGSAFPFTLTTGFAGFDTPATFLEFNRALAARVDVYMENYADALTALEQSFLDTGAALDLGVYHTYSTGAGDLTNPFFEQPQGVLPNYLAHPSIADDAELQPSGDPDRRVQDKLRFLPQPKVLYGLTAGETFKHYESPGAWIPIIRNEELILVRAEARWQTGDIAGAIADVNFIRQQSGGLAPRTDLNAGNLGEAILQQRMYSLFLEGGHRWLDTRRFGVIQSLPVDLPNHVIHVRFPVPADECLARTGSPNCSA